MHAGIEVQTIWLANWSQFDSSLSHPCIAPQPKSKTTQSLKALFPKSKEAPNARTSQFVHGPGSSRTSAPRRPWAAWSRPPQPPRKATAIGIPTTVTVTTERSWLLPLLFATDGHRMPRQQPSLDAWWIVALHTCRSASLGPAPNIEIMYMCVHIYIYLYTYIHILRYTNAGTHILHNALVGLTD